MAQDVITCGSFSGGERTLPKECFVFRPSVYAIIRDGDRILRIRGHWTNGQWWFPGGGCEASEHLVDALRREVYEELGIEVCVAQLLHHAEKLLYFDPEDAAWHVLAFFFACTANTTTLQPDGDEVIEVEWVHARDLQPEEFIDIARPVVELIRAS